MERIDLNSDGRAPKERIRIEIIRKSSFMSSPTKKENCGDK